MLNCIGLQLPRFSPRQKQLLQSTSPDFIGINHYSTFYVKDCIYSECSSGSDRPIRGFLETTTERDGTPIGQPTGKARFFVVPRGLEKAIDYVKQRYNNKPMFVTENGFASPIQQNERVEDLLQDIDRVKYHKDYLSAVASAVRNGANVQGYFVWSLLDNFEWADGYNSRFGLYYVDRTTLKRSPKLSARWLNNFLTNDTAATSRFHQGSVENSVRKTKNVPLTSSSEANKTETIKTSSNTLSTFLD
ncbi:putative inactive beta-glucosidase 14 [Morus notabilis]|uniref:Putative inactive beta-glucosidase 14 n=1 Tax=Morus notabilis TaxID=981085 RepID=W9RJI0_9ROSA|nr:probable inactive beta-glucosidase 14 [Morus notabilis]EXB76319.1 putative inactive beta-glucosidase 14 [Morus notabilis]